MSITLENEVSLVCFPPSDCTHFALNRVLRSCIVLLHQSAWSQIIELPAADAAQFLQQCTLQLGCQQCASVSLSRQYLHQRFLDAVISSSLAQMLINQPLELSAVVLVLIIATGSSPVSDDEDTRNSNPKNGRH